jgi:hypothetical protein
MPRFLVDLENPKGFFYPGEVIAGHITVILDEAIKIKKITLKFEGDGRVEWTTGSGNEREFHSNHEVYFKNKLLLMEAPEPENFIMVQPGEFHYPFRFQLPPNLPPSTIVAVDGGRCNVQYYMEIEVFTTTKMKTVDRTSFITFMV